ncbi:hypothetical protein L596_008622 [Steinernema carpocapsae]|uniref:Uncharacterized protein n=1 Tax=Steinernema carpocapsae TaxID=34508 RepID=A0A4U5PD22_STECR|nr:hypothetical protein L596_008622 [Steinernema carpocapsae]
MTPSAPFRPAPGDPDRMDTHSMSDRSWLRSNLFFGFRFPPAADDVVAAAWKTEAPTTDHKSPSSARRPFICISATASRPLPAASLIARALYGNTVCPAFAQFRMSASKTAVRTQSVPRTVLSRTRSVHDNKIRPFYGTFLRRWKVVGDRRPVFFLFSRSSRGSIFVETDFSVSFWSSEQMQARMEF